MKVDLEKLKPQPAVRKRDKVASVVGWVFAVLLVPTGVISILAGPTPHQRFAGLSSLMVGLIVAPPVTRWLRARFAFLRPLGLPAAIAFGVLVVMSVANPFPAPEGDKQIAAGEQPADPPVTPAKIEPTQAAVSPEPTKPRVTIVPPDSRMAPAQDALNRGDVTKAIQLFFARPVTGDDRASPDGVKLRDAIQAAMDRENGRDPSAEFAEDVNSRLLPKLNAMATTPPASGAELWKRLDGYEEFARILEENPAAKLNPEGLKARSALIAAVSKRQQADFPVLRKAYEKAIRQVVFRYQVDVAVGGSGAKRITLTSPFFAANANIEDIQSGVRDNLRKLRFTRAEYRWAKGLDDGYHYDMTSPADGAVGHWDTGGFARIQ